MAVEVAPSKIRVNAICPGAMPTTNFGVYDPAQAFQEKPEELLTMVAQMQPLLDVTTPEDCANAALFLASDRSRMITGVMLPIDGGHIAP